MTPAAVNLADLTRDEHLTQAQRLVTVSKSAPVSAAMRFLALAQIHATLAGPTPPEPVEFEATFAGFGAEPIDVRVVEPIPTRKPTTRRTPEKTETAP